MFKVGDKVKLVVPDSSEVDKFDCYCGIPRCLYVSSTIYTIQYVQELMEEDFEVDGLQGVIIKDEGEGVYEVQFENGSAWSPLDVCMVLVKGKSEFNKLLG